MTIVILSAGTLTQSKMHTISIKACAGVVAAVIFAALAGGFAIGYAVERPVLDKAESEVVIVPLDIDQSEGRLLIDRFGELSGRIVQLEAEAMELTARIGVIKDFESRVKSDSPTVPSPSRVAKTPAGAPAGGPLLAPSSPSGTSFGVPPLLERIAAAGPESQPEAISGELARLERDVGRVANTLAAIDRIATSYNLAHMSFPGRLPVVDASVTSGFGNRVDPFRRRLAFHSGVDYPAPKGTPIYASAGGRVIYSGYRKDYGNTVEIDHGAGLATRYAHGSRLHVKVGQVVLPGQKIAEVGSTGRSTGPHLHFEILKDGRTVDPTVYLARF